MDILLSIYNQCTELEEMQQPVRQVPALTSLEEVWGQDLLKGVFLSHLMNSVHHVHSKKPITIFLRDSRYFGGLLIIIPKYLIP